MKLSLGYLALPLVVRASLTQSPFLDAYAASVGFPRENATLFTISGWHTARGFLSPQALTPSTTGMRQDCDYIRTSKKIVADFRRDVLGSGVWGFFGDCSPVVDPTTYTTHNNYSFVISSANASAIEVLKTKFADETMPIVFDAFRDTWWIDEPYVVLDEADDDAGALFLGRIAASLNNAVSVQAAAMLVETAFATEEATALNRPATWARCEETNESKELVQDFMNITGVTAFLSNCSFDGTQSSYDVLLGAPSETLLEDLCPSRKGVYQQPLERQGWFKMEVSCV